MTRTVTDNALVLNIIAGHDPEDPGSARAAVPDFTADLDKGVKGLKIGVIRHSYTQDYVADPEMTRSIEDAVAVLASQGADIQELDPGPLANYAATTRVILLSETYAIHERWLQERPQDYGALMRERVMTGAFFRAVDYIQATRQRAVLVQQFARCMAAVDVAITASSMDPACPIEDEERCEFTYNRQARAPFNLTGSLAVAVPTGFASTGLPLSMQIIGKPFDRNGASAEFVPIVLVLKIFYTHAAL